MITTETNDKSKCPGGLSTSLDLCAKIDEGKSKVKHRIKFVVQDWEARNRVKELAWILKKSLHFFYWGLDPLYVTHTPTPIFSTIY